MRTDLPAQGTATVLVPGLLPDVPAYTVKINAKFPGASPALRGIVCLHSLEDGRLLRHERAVALADLSRREFGVIAEVVDVHHAAERDIVILATWSRRPLLTARDEHPGHHLTSLGADEPGKRELSPDLLSSATLIVDDRELTNTASNSTSSPDK